MNSNSIKYGLAQIAKKDKDIKIAVKQYGFETFVNTIVSQQLSAKAATSIMQRLQASVGIVNPENILKKRTSSLRKAGLSERKVSYVKGLAKAIKDGEFNPDKLPTMNDAEAIHSITRLYGFGEWSAEIYLMFSLGRKDIFPANDLALQISLAKLKGLKHKPTPKQARELVQSWSPWRSMGSLFLWHFYQQIK